MEDREPVIFAVFQTGSRANGGVESITQVLTRLRRVRPIVVTQVETPVNARWRQAGAAVKVWEVPYRINSDFFGAGVRQQLQKLRTMTKTNQAVYELVREADVRVVHLNDPAALWHTVIGARLAGARVIYNIRDTRAPDEQARRWKWKLAFRITDRQVVLSREMRQFWERHIAGSVHADPVKSIHAIYSIVDLETMCPVRAEHRRRLRQQLGIGPDELALGYVATFNEKKAQLAFIKGTMPRLKRCLPHAKVYFLGDFEPETNPYAQRCLEAVKRLGLEECIHFAGYTDAVADWYKALDLTVLASRKEGLARCMIESVACGTPVVSFDVCSAREILEGYRCGRVAEQGNHAALARHIEALAADADVRGHMGERGAEAARALFCTEAVVRQYEALYLALAEAGGAVLPVGGADGVVSV